MPWFVAHQQAMQFLFVDRLGQIIIHPGAQQFFFLSGHGVRGHRNNRRLLLMRELADKLAGANTVHTRHLNIHQNQIELHLFSLFHCLRTAGTQFHMLNLILQQHANQLQVCRVIVHRHHAHRQLLLVADERQRVLAQTTVFGERWQQACGRERFEQAGGGPVVFQLFGVNLCMARQGQQQVVSH